MYARLLAVLVALLAGLAGAEAPLVGRHEELCAAFREYSGAALVFEESELPPGVYHDLMVPLSDARRVAAARIAERESRKLPRYFLRDVGIRAIGVFASCASRDGDGLSWLRSLARFERSS